MNLPNWSTNSHLRRVLHNMQSDYTTIFGGRERELAALDAWLEDDANPYALLLAPTGRGKTALVWHWLERQQHEWQVIFVPISIRYGNSNQADVLAALTHAFAHMHGELEEFAALQQTPSELQPKLAAYLRRELPDNTRVLLAIDGLDEATGWELGADLLPEDPPANLKILLSARDMAQHQRADWYHKLGLQSEQTHDFALAGLDRLALKELLIALGTPLDELAADFDVLGELLRVSAGDPVIVRLLVQLLREERIQIGQISQLPADDLNAVFALWLNQLSAQQSQIAQILLLLFANAYGPLSARDLLGLAPDHFADAEQIGHAIAPLARFVIGDAETGYVFSHQKLRELYRDRLDAQTLAEWNARFVQYGKQAYLEPTPYLCRFLVNHLRDAGEWQFTRDLLADFSPQQHWAEARYALEGSYSGYLRDLELLQNWAIAQNDLALNIHCSLIASSIISLSSNLSGELLAQLVTVGTRKGKWSVEAALAHLEQGSSSGAWKLRHLIEAGIALPWERALEIVEQQEYIAISDYLTIYPIVPQTFQAELLQRIFSMWDLDNVWADLTTILERLHGLDEATQNLIWEKLLELDHDEITSDLSWNRSKIPEAWLPQFYQRIKAYALDRLQYNATHEINEGERIWTIITYWEFMPSEQQSLAYWGLSYPQLMRGIIDNDEDYRFLQELSDLEQQECINYLLQVDLFQEFEQIQADFSYIDLETIVYRCSHYLLSMLHILQHTNRLSPTIRNNIRDFLLAQPQYISHKLLAYFPATDRDRLIEHVLHILPTEPDSLEYPQMLLELLPYFAPERQQILIEHLYLDESKISSNRQSLSLQIDLLTYFPQDQQQTLNQTILQQIQQSIPVDDRNILYANLLKQMPQLREQIWQMSMDSLPDSIEDVFAQLIEQFTPPQQAEIIDQIFKLAIQQQDLIENALYPYLNPAQVEALLQLANEPDHDYFRRKLMEGLCMYSNYPLPKLLSAVEQYPDRAHRLHLLAYLDQHKPQQTEIKLVMQQTIEQFFAQNLNLDEIRHFMVFYPGLANELVDYYIQNLEQNFQYINQDNFELESTAQKRLGQALWLYLKNNPEWPLSTIIHNRVLFRYCLPFFVQQQIQAALDDLSDHDLAYHCRTLLPYLTQQQLQQLDPIIKELNFARLIDFYLNAIQYHPDYAQTNYYQYLLERCYAEQANTDPENYFSYLHTLAPYLQAPDRKALILWHLQHLYKPYDNFMHAYGFGPIIPLLHDNGMLNAQSIQLFAHFAGKHRRATTLVLLDTILPPYLDTLVPEQQHELASQIYRSVEQIVAAWP